MSTPPLLVGAALLLWGWETGYLLFGALMGVLLEMHRAIKARWEFSDEDYNRLWNLCSVLFIGGAVAAFASNDGTSVVSGLFQPSSFSVRTNAINQGVRAAVVFIQWMPFFFFPFMLAQAFSSRDKADFSTFSLVLRRRKKTNRPPPAPSRGENGLNIAYPYFALCLISTSTANVHGVWFYLAASTAIIWALWPFRSRRFGLNWWGGLAVAVGILGFLGAHGLQRVQRIVENLNVSFLSRWYGRKPPDKIDRYTSIGRIGNLKQSGTIVMRLDAEGTAPELIRESSYSMFSPKRISGGQSTEYRWTANHPNYTNVYFEPGGTTWNLLKNKPANRSVRISQYLDGGAGFLAIPNGTAQLENLPVNEVRKNPFGVVGVTQGPGLVQYLARYGPGATIDSEPENIDRQVPAEEMPALEEIVSQLRLGAMSHRDALRVVEDFFRTNFEYTTFLTAAHAATSNETALAVFLRHVRKGHCEYFATATTLLLRQAEIPARYATGYSVQERDKKGQYIIRERHAHAWCLVYIDGHWQDFDTTPASWLESELEHRSFWEPVSDLWSNLWFKFSEWRYGDTNYQQYLGWIVAGLILFLAVRLFLKKEWKRRKERGGGKPAVPWPGADSEFYQIESRLEGLGFPRQRGESYSDWLARVERSSELPAQPLRDLLQLHYRYRFDPHGITAEDRQSIRQLVNEWLDGQKRTVSS